MGGFDASISKPAMEDIEFGFRLRRAGHRIRICVAARGTHLKNWTVRQLWRDDVFSRAIPWSGMIIDGKGPATLNASRKEQIKAVLIHGALLLIAAGLLFPPAAILGVLLLSLFCFANLRFWRVLFNMGGGGAGFAGVGLHTAYYIYSSVVFGSVYLQRTALRLLGVTVTEDSAPAPQLTADQRT
jgi:hypothetical protein